MKYLLKQRRTIGAFGLVAIMVFAYACNDLNSVNDDPNQPSQAPTTYLITSAQKDLADNYVEGSPGALAGYFGNLYAQYWAQNQYSDESRYAYRPGIVNAIWNNYYLSLNSLQQIIRQNQNNPEGNVQYGNNANQIAAAKVMKAWTYQTLTDIYGDIPFNAALDGASNPSPSYTSQDSVYMGIINMLTEASDSIVVDEAVFTGGDIFYDGDAAKWKKLANSLKMRAAIRIADANPQFAQTAFQEAEAAGAMTSNDDNALFTYNEAPPNNNPINETYKDRDDFAVSSTLLDFMNSNEDPRRGAYAAKSYTSKGGERGDVPAGADDYIGFPYGLEQGKATPLKNTGGFSRPSLRVRAATFPAIFMTYSEVAFAETEAAQRGWTSDDAAAKYGEAIQASMDYWDVNSADAASYIANNPYDAVNWRQNLGRQKWVALYEQGIQGWSVWRRLDFGLLSAPVSGKVSVNFDAPVALRYPYPTDEVNLNGANVESAISDQEFSEDDQGQKLWWDAQAEGAN